MHGRSTAPADVAEFLGADDRRATLLLAHFARLSDAFWHRVDEPTDTDGAELFTDDGVLQLGPLVLEGREAVRQFLTDRARSLKAKRERTCHIASNYVLSALDPHRAVVTSILTVYPVRGDLPAAVRLPSSVGRIQDTLVRC